MHVLDSSLKEAGKELAKQRLVKRKQQKRIVQLEDTCENREDTIIRAFVTDYFDLRAKVVALETKMADLNYQVMEITTAIRQQQKTIGEQSNNIDNNIAKQDNNIADLRLEMADQRRLIETLMKRNWKQLEYVVNSQENKIRWIGSCENRRVVVTINFNFHSFIRDFEAKSVYK